MLCCICLGFAFACRFTGIVLAVGFALVGLWVLVLRVSLRLVCLIVYGCRLWCVECLLGCDSLLCYLLIVLYALILFIDIFCDWV